MQFENGSNIVAIELRGEQFCCETILVISDLKNNTKKIFDSDWLREVLFKCNNSAKNCNTGAKSVTPVQITHCNSEL